MASVWESAGVMLPYLDMLNHKTGTAQLTWKLSDEEVIVAGRRGMVSHGRTRKHCKLLTTTTTVAVAQTAAAVQTASTAVALR